MVQVFTTRIDIQAPAFFAWKRRRGRIFQRPANSQPAQMKGQRV